MSTEFIERLPHTPPVEPETLDGLWQARLRLSQQMGEIMADRARYHSPEFDTCVRGITEANRLFRKKQWEEYTGLPAEL